MESEETKTFLQTCQYFSHLAEKLKETTNMYHLEVLSDNKMLEKRKTSVIKMAFKIILNILERCDIFIESVDKNNFEKMDFYKELLEHINIHKRKSKEPILSNDKSVQTDCLDCEGLQNENIVEEQQGVNRENKDCEVPVVKEELSGYESEETVLLNRLDTDLNDVMDELNAACPENSGKELDDQVVTPTKRNSSCSTEDSFVFNLNCDTLNNEHSKNQSQSNKNVLGDDNKTMSFRSIEFEQDLDNSINGNHSNGTLSAETIIVTSPEITTIKEEIFDSIFEKSTQLFPSDVEAGIEERAKKESDEASRVNEQFLNEDSSHSQNFQLYVEHESDFEEDDDFCQLKDDDIRDSDLLSSSSYEDTYLEFSSSKSNCFSEADESTDSVDGICERDYSLFNIKECVVNIKRLPQKVIDKYYSKINNTADFHDKTKMENEDTLTRLTSELNRLMDLSTLKNPEKRSGKSSTKKSIKKRKTQFGEIETEQSAEDSIATDSDNDDGSSVTNMEVDVLQEPLGYEDLQYEILKNLSGDSDNETEGESYSNSSFKCETDTIKKTSKGSKSVKDYSIKRKIAKWRRDSLLCGKLTSSDSSSDSDIPKPCNTRCKKRVIYSDSEDSENVRVLAEDMIKKEEVVKEESKENSEVIKEEIKQSSEEVQPFVNSAPLYEVTEIVSPSAECNSDVEFVSTKENQKKTEVYLNSDGESITDVEEQHLDEEAKRRRRNIRKVLEDVNLEEDTKKANKEEEAHRHRILEKQKELESWSQSSESSQVQGLVLDLDKTTKLALVTVDPILTKRLKPHQVQGVRFMWDVCYESVHRLQQTSGTGCILAHCMGLGKTYQVIVLIHTLFAHPETQTSHVLVVCPLSTVLNWVNEFERGLSKVENKVNVFYIRKQDVAKIKVVRKWRNRTGVLILGYESYERLVRSDSIENKEVIEALSDPGPDLIICDEGHLIKNGKAFRSQAVNRVKTRRRIILTGTPIQNNLKEYFYMVDFVKPKLLGTYKEYCNRFVNPITNGQYHDSTPHDIKIMKKRSHVLHKLLRSTVQRYEVSELEKQIPRKLDYVIFIKIHPLQARLYQQYLNNIRTGDITRMAIFGHYSRLQGIVTHPYVLDLKEKHETSSKKNERREVEVINLEPEIKENQPLPCGWWRNFCPDDYRDNLNYSPKFRVMLKIIDECEKIGDKILIFSNSIPEIDAIECFLKKRTVECRQWKRGKDYFRMDGTVPPEERSIICDAFNNSENTKAKVLLMSYKVGGLGLNMVAANRVILMDVNWNPSYETQSIFRVYRFGQVKECFIYRLVAMGTMEEIMYQRSVTKLSIAGRVIDERQIRRHYKCAELQEMLRFNINLEEIRPIPKPPTDKLLAKLLLEMESEIFKYHEHQALLENRPDEELNEEEMKLAWDEYHQEQTRAEEIRAMETVNVSNLVNSSANKNRRVEDFSIQNNLQNRSDYAGVVPNSNNANVDQNNIMNSSTINRLQKLLSTFPQRPYALTKTPNPFKSNNLENPIITPEAHQPSTSSGISSQINQEWRITKHVMDFKQSISENNVTGKNQQQNKPSENRGSEIVEALRREYSRILERAPNPEIGSKKKTEIVTPRIESVYSEAPISNLNSRQRNEIIDVDGENTAKTISNNSSVRSLPKTTVRKSLEGDDIIEIV